jgi:hypothetical protein
MSTFISRCVWYGADLNQRNDNGKRPLDVAWDNYYHLEKKQTKSEAEAKDVVRKAQIVRSFLTYTPHTSDYELYWHLKNKELIPDVIGVIFRHYYTVTIDRDVMLSPIVFDNWSNIEKIKNELLVKKLQTLKIKG